MHLIDSINKTKTFFRRTLNGFKRFLYSPGYQKLRKPPSFRPKTDEVSSHEWQTKKEPEIGNGNGPNGDAREPSGSTVKASKEVSFSFSVEEEKKMAVSRKGEGLGLARKMKELEMMDVGDMDHVLDVEEAIHYYSRLTSPVYVGIVDSFFMDMYTDFSDAPPRGSVLRPVVARAQARGGLGRRDSRW